MIQFWGLDADFNLRTILSPINVQWKREYYKAGSFSIQLPATQYYNDLKYIYTRERPELGVINQVNFSTNKQNVSSVQISGYFLEKELDDKIIYPTFIGNGNLESEIKRMVAENLDGIPLLEIATSQGRFGNVEFTAELSYLGEQLASILETFELGYKVIYDYENNIKTFDIYQGVDRTGETTDNPITFSTTYGNLEKPSVVVKDLDFKNYALVKGTIDKEDFYVEADLSGGGYKKKTIIENSGVRYDKNTMTEDQYKEALMVYGMQKLVESNNYVQNITFDANVSGYEYLKDFNLGDKCTIIINEIKLTLTARIISIYEVWKDSKHEITLEFGNQIRRN